MKKITILSACLGLIVNLTAQTSPTASLGKTTFGFRAGVNFQNINGKDNDGDELTNKMAVRWHAGINCEIPVAVDFYFQPGVLYSGKGAKSEFMFNNSAYKSDVRLDYIEVPLYLMYKPLLGTGHLILGFGPYVAYGFGGKAKYEGGGRNYEEKVKYKSSVTTVEDNDATYFKAFDAGANIAFGYEMSNRLSFQLNVQLGLVNIQPDFEAAPNSKAVLKNTGFGVSLGYRL